MAVGSVAAMLVSLLAASASCVETDAFALTSDYFLRRGARIIVGCLCSDHGRLAFTKILSGRGLWALAIGSHQAGDILNVLAPWSEHKTGVFVDRTCAHGRAILDHGWARGLPCLAWGGEGPPALPRLDSDVAWARMDTPGLPLPVPNPQGRAPGSWVPGPLHPRVATDLAGTTLRAALVPAGPPHKNNVSKNVNQDIINPSTMTDELNAYHYTLFSHLMKWFNFSIAIVPTSLTANEDKYEVLMKMVRDKEVDVTISPIFPDSQMLNTVQFVSASPSALRMKVVFRRPSLTESPGAMLRPFTGQLWAAAALLWSLAAAFLRLLSACRDQSESAGEARHSWGDVALLVAGTVAEQGSEMDSKWVTWRLVFSTMLMLTVLLNNYYNACVVSWLLSEAPGTISDLEKLVRSPLRFGCQDIGYLVPYFETNDDPLMRELYTKKMFRDDGGRAEFYTLHTGVRKALAEDFAFLADADRVYGLIEATFPEEEKCSLAELPLVPPRSRHLALPLHSPYKELFSYGVGWLQESGVADRDRQRWRPWRSECLSPPPRARGLGLAYAAPALGVALLGLMLSPLALAAELAWRPVPGANNIRV